MGRSRAPLTAVTARPPVALDVSSRLIWTLGLGAFGLAWSITTVAAYLPPILDRYTDSGTVIGLVLASEGVFAFLQPLLVGPMSDATQTSIGRRRPFMILALAPMALALAALPFMSTLHATALALFVFFFAYYLYEPPYRGLYPDCLSDTVFGRAQGVQHLLRGAALGGGLVGGGFLLAVWEPFPFVLAAAVTATACGAVVLFVHEPPNPKREYERLRTYFSAPWRVVRRERNVRRFLIANAAWEATFAGMRTFVVLYIIEGLDQPLYVSSAVLAVVAGGYVVAAAVVGQ
jgi:Na+/melibiose symporter-like transporter